MSVLCQFYVHLPRAAPPEPLRSKNITRDETPMSLQNARVRTPCVVRAASSSVEVAPATDEAHFTGRGSVPRGATPAADAEGGCSLGLVLVLSLARLLVDRPRRGPPGAKRSLRLRCCASASAPRCASLASCSPRSPLLGVSFNATPSIKLCLCLGGGGPAARRLAVCCLRSLLERNGRWVGRPRAGLAARTFHPPIPSRSGRKPACCLVLADVIFFFAHSWSEKNALWSPSPAVVVHGPWRRRRGMAALWQR